MRRRPALFRSISESQETVEAADIEELLELVDESGVNISGCDSMEEIRACLLQEISRSKTRNPALDIWSAPHQSKLKEEFDHQREELCKIYRSTETSLSPSVDSLSQILTREGEDTDLTRDILHRLQVLQSGQCNVLIAGETNAGKSSLLNLLLGVEVLPKSILGCTAEICKISFSPDYRVRVVHKGGEEEERAFPDPPAMRSFLKETVATWNEREREVGPAVQMVHVLLPANVLKSGITIIDSPGFGETPALDAVARDFVINNDVDAFVYIIKTDNGGGVQEDRLIHFLKKILSIKSRKSDWSHYFNPGAALFVCNRWDLISDREKPRVRDHVLSKLRSVWPGLEQTQVSFFSCVQETDDTAASLHESLNSIFSLARQGVIARAYNWLRYIVRECTFCLKTMVNSTNKHEASNSERLVSANNLLSALNSDSQNSIDSLKTELKQEQTAFTAEIRRYLTSSEMAKELSHWEVEDIPDFRTIRDDDLSRLRDEVIVQRIIDILDFCPITTKLFSKILEGNLQTQMTRIGQEMDDVTSDLRDSTSSNELGKSLLQGEESGMAGMNRDVLSRIVTSVSGLKQHFGERNPSGVIKFIDLTRRLVKVAGETWSSHSRLQRVRKTSLPTVTDPYMLMTQKARDIASVISKDDDLLKLVISRYIYVIECEIDRLILHVPQFVSQIRRLISQVNQLCSNTKTKKTELQNTMVNLEQQRELVRGYGYVHIKDIHADDLKLQLDDPRLKSSSVVTVSVDEERPDFLSNALWSRFQQGTLCIDDGMETITVRYYIHQLEDPHLYREVAKLRCLSHFSVAAFVGMTRAESQSAFIFPEELTTARAYLRQSRAGYPRMPGLKEAVPKLLEGLVEGLAYIHRNGLVHMELTADTVMLKYSGDVKLAGMCLPRHARLPVELNTIEAGDFTCLSPEVLRGEIYKETDDIYSLGLLVSEIMLERRPFETQRTWTLARFISQVDPSIILSIPDLTDSQVLHELLFGCLVHGPAERLLLYQIEDLVLLLKQNDLLDRLDTKSRLRNDHRRPSALWSADVTSAKGGNDTFDRNRYMS